MAAAVAGGEAALVEVQVVYDVGIEAGEQASEVTDVIQGNAVQQEEIVVSVSSMHVQAAHELVTGCYAGKQLQFLDDVGGAEYGYSAL